jgi:hypothetical protein
MASRRIDDVFQLLLHVDGRVRNLRDELATLPLAPNEELYFTRMLNEIELTAASLADRVLRVRAGH